MKNSKLTLYLILIMVFVWGCDDLFDVTPATSLPPEDVITSGEGVEALRESMYSKQRESFAYTTQHFLGSAALTDLTRNRPGSTRFQALTQATDGDGGRSHITSWTGTYNIVQDANIMIGAVDDDAIETLDQETLERFRGEAYAIRAFAFHNLVRVMGYEPGNFDQGPEANWDRGIVLQTDPVFNLDDVIEAPRASVDDVYAQIRSDLDEAESRLQGVTDNTRMNEAFVHGVRARVELYAGEWAAARDAATDAIAAFPGALVDTPEGVDGMFVEGAGDHPEALYKLVVDPNTEPIAGSNVNDGPAAYTSDQWGAQLPTNVVLDKYEEGDYRYDGWYEDCFNAQEGEPFANCDAVNANGWTLTKFNGGKGNLADDLPYMRLSEMFLIKAEAAAKAGSVADGLPHLNDLREARGVGSLDQGDFSNMDDFEDEILDERVRELVGEGHRFYDLKRLQRPVLNIDGSTKFRADSHRILGPVPIGEQDVNAELEENPGY